MFPSPGSAGILRSKAVYPVIKPVAQDQSLGTPALDGSRKTAVRRGLKMCVRLKGFF